MAHMIDETTGKAAIAYVGETPWHGLGKALSPGMGIEVWREEAGLNYTVERAPVQFRHSDDETLRSFVGRDVLYRSDTLNALSVVSKGYTVVQPGEILEFFSKLAEIGGFELETAGALSGGQRVWALAKVNDGAPVVGQDVVRPYVLLATSYDGTLATTAKFTAIRVVCHNTLTMSAGYAGGTKTVNKGEEDTEGRAVSSLVRIPHSAKFDADQVRLQLGIVNGAFEQWLVNTRIMSEVRITEAAADDFVFSLLSHGIKKDDGKNKPDVRKSKPYQAIMGLFSGGAIGANLTGGDNAWALMNAVSEYIDHTRGRTVDTRLSSAWFGTGDALKTRAYDSLLAACRKMTA